MENMRVPISDEGQTVVGGPDRKPTAGTLLKYVLLLHQHNLQNRVFHIFELTHLLKNTTETLVFTNSKSN